MLSRNAQRRILRVARIVLHAVSCVRRMPRPCRLRRPLLHLLLLTLPRPSRLPSLPTHVFLCAVCIPPPSRRLCATVLPLLLPSRMSSSTSVEAWRATLIATTATLLMYSSRVSRMPLAPCSNQLVCESMRPWFGCLMLRTIPHLRLRTKPFLSPPSCRQPSMPFIPKLKERSCLAV